MTSFFQLLVFLAFGFGFASTFNFSVYWNVPSHLCHIHKVKFEEETTKHGIITNSGEKFLGEKIGILYDPGVFPIMCKQKDKTLVEQNGGIPQLGNLTLHLEGLREVIENSTAKNFSGLGIIDFEHWRPIFRQNWNDQVVYRNMSIDLERQKRPQLPEANITAAAKENFEKAAQKFMQETLKKAKQLRPGASWGYYGFPYCYNFKKKGGPKCPDLVERENNRMGWLWEESTAYYPSMYIPSTMNATDYRRLIGGRLDEVKRIATLFSKFTVTYPYLWFRHNNNDTYLSKNHIDAALETIKSYKLGGAIIWGASKDVSNKNKCKKLLDYVKDVLGPSVQNLLQTQPNNPPSDEDNEIPTGTSGS